MPHSALGRRGAFAYATFALLFACNTENASESDDAPTSSVVDEMSVAEQTDTTTETNTVTPVTSVAAPDTSEDALCERGCVATLAAKCPNGPKTQPQCVQDCKDLAAGSCAAPYESFRTCADGETLSCNEMGIPFVPACSDQQQAFFTCLNDGN